MAIRSGLSVTDKLVLAASDLERTTGRPFSAEDLVVAAWRMFPDTFGLAGYTADNGTLSYPDSNRVFAEIMGSKPIRKRGFLTKVGSKMYQLTESGQMHGRLLQGGSAVEGAQKAGLSRSLQHELLRLLNTKVVLKYRSGRREEITFHDACTYWGISPRTSAIDYNGRMENFRGIVDSVRAALQGREMTIKHGGATISLTDVDQLVEAHEYLLERFHHEIEFILRRTDERL
ncbi:MAG: hypothetical protein AB1792_08655 [Candidatus Zixiibacteriota bacterium]